MRTASTTDILPGTGCPGFGEEVCVRLPLALTLTVAVFMAPGPSGLRAVSEPPRQQIGPAGHVPQETAERQDLGWFAAVERHEIGQMDAAAELLAGWSTDQMERVGVRAVSYTHLT